MSQEYTVESMKTADLHLGKLILSRLKSFGDNINQIELVTDASETHASFLLRTIRVAQAMKMRGIGIGDVSVICADTHNDIGVPTIASTYIGCAFFPFSASMKKTEIKNLLESGKHSIIFCDPGVAPIFAEAQTELGQNAEIVVFGSKLPEGNFTPFDEFLKPTGIEEEFEATEFDPAKTLLFIACSSGTTGLPKGVCHTHKSFGYGFLLMSIEDKRTIDENTLKNSANLGFSTLFWLSGIWNLMISVIFGVRRINCIAPYSVELVEKALKKYKPTETLHNPVATCELVKHPRFLELDWSSMKTFLVGGSSASPDVNTKIRERLNNGCLLYGYGMTEGGRVLVNFNQVPNSIGQMSSWIQWKVVDPDKEEICGPNVVGELRLKSETLFYGYLNNPTATAAAFDDEGYYKTGDLVTYDEDENFFFEDRIKEMMKYKNYQITPAELEFEIIKLPSVVQVAVVAKKHPEDGEHPLAFVQKLPGSDLTAKEIKDCVKNALSDLKQLRGGVVFLQTLPKTPSGKVDRKVLKVMAQQVEGQ